MSDLGALTERLIAIPSVSGEEAAILDTIRAELPASLTIVEGDAVLLALPERRPGAPLILLAGHVDTVPVGRSAPRRREGDTIHGRGAADMKGGLAVMLALADELATGRFDSDFDTGFLFFGREELPFARSALLPFLRMHGERGRSLEPDGEALAIVLEPTDNRLELGCLGNLTIELTVEGAAAHTARPWLGRNAIHQAIERLAPLAARASRDVSLDGLMFREVVSITGLQGGLATNVVPDRATATINLRYGPATPPEDAERELVSSLAGPNSTVEVLGNAPPGPVPTASPLVDRLRTAGDLAVAPKQAWTPVAEFGLIGIDAVNFGPGDPEYAHRDDERVEIAALDRAHDVLRAFLRNARTGG
ncbi:MAG TPA: succinyl-diaminopimelate desuccinylase [Actinomycetota bacterium]|nr:succinyl-diaminopimelate desuccinylase [Actinomycetota bacterium]